RARHRRAATRPMRSPRSRPPLRMVFRRKAAVRVRFALDPRPRPEGLAQQPPPMSWHLLSIPAKLYANAARPAVRVPRSRRLCLCGGGAASGGAGAASARAGAVCERRLAAQGVGQVDLTASRAELGAVVVGNAVDLRAGRRAPRAARSWLPLGRRTMTCRRPA